RLFWSSRGCGLYQLSLDPSRSERRQGDNEEEDEDNHERHKPATPGNPESPQQKVREYGNQVNRGTHQRCDHPDGRAEQYECRRVQRKHGKDPPEPVPAQATLTNRLVIGLVVARISSFPVD
ncbi:MAG TPA: hypothetical protein VMS31_06405, partial [Pyrinomonadaceae bacterium]|nr:hypothetical protein [Pyrinomonadaceae bacterium]